MQCPEPPSTSDLAAELEAALVGVWARAARHHRRRADLSRTSASVLNMLSERPRRITELAAAQAVAQPTMTVAVQRLEARGLVTRERATDDRRATNVVITDAGRATLAARHAARVRRAGGPPGRPHPRPAQGARRRAAGTPRPDSRRAFMTHRDQVHHLDPAPAAIGLRGRLRLRRRLHGHRPRRPDPPVDRHQPARLALAGRAALHLLLRRHGDRDARHRLGLLAASAPRRRSWAASRSSSSSPRSPAPPTRSPSSSASAAAGAWATPSSPRPR